MSEGAPTAGPSRRQRNAVVLGAALALLSSLLLTSNDIAAKQLTRSMPVGEIMALRGGLVLVMLSLLFTVRRCWSVVRITNRRAMSIRALSMVAGTFLFLNALSLMPIADAVAIVFVSPLFATVLSIPILGERVGWRRWAAVSMGLVGVAIVLQPAGAGYVWTVALLPLACAFFTAFRDITSRQLTATDASLGVLFYTVSAISLAGLATSLMGNWVVPDTEHWGLLSVAAVFIGFAHFLQVESYRYAEVSFLAPLRYVSLIFAAVMGFVVFGDVPGWNVVIGAGIIVAGGLIIWHRQSRPA